jgi:hypothetical protein
LTFKFKSIMIYILFLVCIHALHFALHICVYVRYLPSNGRAWRGKHSERNIQHTHGEYNEELDFDVWELVHLGESSVEPFSTNCDGYQQCMRSDNDTSHNNHEEEVTSHFLYVCMYVYIYIYILYIILIKLPWG